jgi:hypothetical protein
MAKFTLIPFPGQDHPNLSFCSEFNQNDGSLYISYKLSGDLSSIDLGEGKPHHSRVLKLWEKTCFELFIQNSKKEYVEFNFSPVFEWNSFYFEKKGDPLKEFQKMDGVKLDILLSLDVFHLIVEIDKKKFPVNFFDKSENGVFHLSAGITGVVKEKSGRLSYWALEHADQRPNFHHPDSFKYKF